MNRRLLWSCLLLLPATVTLADDDPVFSGPQVGERLPGLMVRGAFADQAGEDIDLLQKADGGPMLLVFFHARTRPAFGLSNML